MEDETKNTIKVKIFKNRKGSKYAHTKQLCANISNWNFTLYPTIVKECAKILLTFSKDVKSSGKNEKYQAVFLRVSF